MQRTLIHGGTVLTMAGPEAVYPGGVVAIEGDRILYAGPVAGAGDYAAERWATHRVDATGQAVLPGLINCHTHAAMNLLRGYADDMPLMPWLHEKIFPAEDRMTAEDIYWGTAQACVESLLSGVTTFCDMYIFMEDVARAVQDAGMRAVLTRGLMGEGEGMDRRFAEARALHQRWHGAAGGRITCMLGPHAYYTVPLAEQKRVVALAEELDCGLHIHVSESPVEVQRCHEEFGCSPVELLERSGMVSRHLVLAHCVNVSAGDIARLARITGGVSHNPVSNLKLGSGVAPVTDMLAAGVTVGLGTDGAASTNTLNLFDEIKLAAWIAKNRGGDPAALNAYQVLAMATAGGARVLGLDDRVGTLAAGQQADVITVDLRRTHMQPCHDLFSVLAYSARPDDVTNVFVAGRAVVQQGRLTSLDPTAVNAEVAARARRLVAG